MSTITFIRSSQRTRIPENIVSVDLTFNGESDWKAIEQEMVRVFDEVGAAYKQKRNRSITAINNALKKANQVIYKEARIRAPIIKPHIQATKQESRKNIHLRDHMIERSASGRKWRAKGIVARRVVTFKAPASEYAAAVEYGRDAFIQVVRKAPFGIKGGQTDYWLRKVGAMEAQPFLRVSQEAKAQEALSVFSRELQKNWLTILKRVNKKRGK
ncbi:hypothetical protein [Vibrio parahaemolyticus]|uniref:hypothetical protein n=1 Tax=Vibrio parahaemolyticus TaxID=670 RepID=UPI00301C69D8